jgi:hypothetical protein
MEEHRRRVMGNLPQRGGEELEERIAQLESDLDQTGAVVEALMLILQEHGILNVENVNARAKALLAGEDAPASSPAPATAPRQAQPSAPVQPVFKKPFVAKRKWDEAAEPPGKDSK